MVDITQALSQNITAVIIYFLIGVAITIYQIYLSFKQSKVHNEMKELNKTTRDIKEILNKKL